jgi:hypothetical protein
MQTEPVHADTIEKTIPKMSTPRVPSMTSMKDISPARIETRARIRKYLETKTMARIPHQSTHLRQTTRSIE